MFVNKLLQFFFQCNCKTSILMSTNYVDTLSQGDGAVYLRELRNSPDPFCAGVNWEQNPKEWPPVSYFDIVNYFVFSTNYYTFEQTKAFRSLDAYLYASAGHVQVIRHLKNDRLTLLLADVLPSQRQGQRTQLYKAFIICAADGQILTAHCTCMAG